MEFSGVASHNSMSKVERYHIPLRRIFRCVRAEHPDISDNICLQMAVKAVNDTAGPQGLVPNMLVFGTMPQLGTTGARALHQPHRFNAMKHAREEASRLVAIERIKSALKFNVPPAARYTLREGDSVMAYSESRKRWVPNLTTVRADGRQVCVNDGKRVVKLNKTHVTPQPSATDKRGISEMLRQLHQFRTPGARILITEVLKPNDPRGRSGEFDPAIAKEMVVLLKKKAFEVVVKEDVPPNANVLNGRFVFTIKNKGTGEELFKARFVVQGHLDQEKAMLVHASTTVKQQSIRMLVALAAICGFDIWTQDASMAYIQGAERILRDVYLRPKEEFKLRGEQFLKVLRPLYGLSDAGDYWHSTFLDHLTGDLGMKATDLDLSMFYKVICNTIGGMTATHVYDTLSPGTPEFDNETERTGDRFDVKAKERGSITFACIFIQPLPDGAFHLGQEQYAEKLQSLPRASDFKAFRSKRHELSWITHTRPDVAADAAILSQVTESTFSSEEVTKINREINRVKAEPKLGLVQHRLNLESLRIIAYSESSFANLSDLGTQLGYVLFLVDDTNRVNWLHFSSYKYKRVVCSVLAGETHSFVDAFDLAFTLRHDMERMLQRSIPLSIITDSDSLFKVLVKSSTTTEKRLMIDIEASRQAYQRREIDNVGWVKSAHNPADCLTKINKAEYLQTIMRSGRLEIEADQWVIRSAGDSSDVMKHDIKTRESVTESKTGSTIVDIPKPKRVQFK